MSGQTYDVNVRAPCGDNGSTGAMSQPTRSAIRNSTAGTDPDQADSNTTGLSARPYDVPAATYRYGSARRFRPPLAPISNSRTGSGTASTSWSRPPYNAAARPTSFV